MYWEFLEFRFQAAIQFPTQKQNKIFKLRFIVLRTLENRGIHPCQFHSLAIMHYLLKTWIRDLVTAPASNSSSYVRFSRISMQGN